MVRSNPPCYVLVHPGTSSHTLFGDYLGTIWGLFGDYVGTIWGLFADYLGTIWGLFGTIWDYFGSIFPKLYLLDFFPKVKSLGR